ncbi:MAG: penicillin-binding protein 1C [Bdellovibrio sp.]
MQKNKILLIFTFFIVILIFFFGWFSVPTFNEVINLSMGSDRVLLDSQGKHLQTLRTDFQKRRLSWYSLNQFSKSIREAVVTAEDKRFKVHFGIDPLSLGRALLANIRGQRIQGASTITMQLGDLIQKEVLLHNSSIGKGHILHKLKQIVRAFFIETKWSKNEILEAYLNLIHLRGEIQGVPAASLTYLKKDPSALNTAESIVIADMISSPNNSLSNLRKKSCTHLQLLGGGSCQEIDAAINSFKEKPVLPETLSEAPHLARRVFKEIPGQTIIKSTLNAELQQKVIAILENNVHRLMNSNVHDSAAIVIENKTGRVLAYVGTVSSSLNPHVDGVMAYRQAGSSLKPFIYAKAISNNSLTAASILLDDPTVISWGGEVYRPTNYDKNFYGHVSVREALASSLNVPAVKTVMMIGLHETYKTLQSLQFSQLKQPDFYGVSMVLGAVEVRLDELANAYRMLANGGVWSPLQFVANVDGGNSIIEKKIFSPESVFIIGSILSDANARSIGFGWETPLETPFWTAVKTGTSKDYRDNWCVGYSERYTVAVWTGNFNAEAMEKVSGVSGAGSSWYQIMSVLHNQEKSLPPSVPVNIIKKNIFHQWSNYQQAEYFIKGTEPLQEIIETATEKNIQFVFPAEGSVLVKDPHLDQKKLALFVRFKGSPPAKSQLLWDKKVLGEAVSPFKVESLSVGDHQLEIATADGKVLSRVQFKIHGAK